MKTEAPFQIAQRIAGDENLLCPCDYESCRVRRSRVAERERARTVIEDLNYYIHTEVVDLDKVAAAIRGKQ